MMMKFHRSLFGVLAGAAAVAVLFVDNNYCQVALAFAPHHPRHHRTTTPPPPPPQTILYSLPTTNGDAAPALALPTTILTTKETAAIQQDDDALVVAALSNFDVVAAEQQDEATNNNGLAAVLSTALMIAGTEIGEFPPRIVLAGFHNSLFCFHFVSTFLCLKMHPTTNGTKLT